MGISGKVVNITHILKKNHHAFSAIMDRVEKAKKERLSSSANAK